jgi:glycosyltransferase involved in cell wall biosynthesis
MINRLNHRFLPTVSIVTPSFNQGKYIEETINSVLSQDYPKIEYIIIDGGSVDQSVEIISKYEKQIACFISEPDKGQSQAINKGIKVSNGEIIGWLNSDDMLVPGSISLIVEEFLKDESLGVVYGRNLRMNQQGKIIPTPKLKKNQIDFGIQYILEDPIVNQPGAFWRKYLVDRIGLLNESLVYTMDYDYWIRLAIHGVKFKRIDQSVAIFRLNPESKTSLNSVNMAIEQIKVIDNLNEKLDLSKNLGLSPKKIWAKIKKNKANAYLKASYGYYKNGQWVNSIKWFLKACWFNPSIIFQRKWLALFLAKMQRM